MATLLVAQAVSGWCCHRPCHCLVGNDVEAKLLESEYSEASPPATPHDDHTGCHHDHNGLIVSAVPHCQCHECQGFCTYVANAKLHVARSLADFRPVLATAIVDSSLLQLAPADDGRTSELCQPEPPVRLHLLHQSLLI
jgi:hypothetical protein